VFDSTSSSRLRGRITRARQCTSSWRTGWRRCWGRQLATSSQQTNFSCIHPSSSTSLWRAWRNTWSQRRSMSCSWLLLFFEHFPTLKPDAMKQRIQLFLWWEWLAMVHDQIKNYRLWTCLCFAKRYPFLRTDALWHHKTRVPTESGKDWKKFFGLLVWKKEIIFEIWSFNIHFHNILFNIDIILLTSC